eukprot:Gb_03684 [translate_table: standard]
MKKMMVTMRSCPKALHTLFSSLQLPCKPDLLLSDYSLKNIRVAPLHYFPNDRRNLVFIHSFVNSFSSASSISHSAHQSANGVSVCSSLPNKLSIPDFLQKSCGLLQKQANAVSKTLVHLKSTKKPEQVLAFFKEHGFTNAHIQKMVARCPILLTSSVQSTLQPKLRVFEDLGIMGDELGYLISKDPVLLRVSLDRKILPGVSILQNIVGTKENVAKIVMREPRIVYINIEKKFKPNLLLLQSYGIEGKTLCSFLFRKPRLFFSTETVLRVVLNTVEKLGIPRRSGMFPHAVFVVSSMNKMTLERKIKFLMGLGLSEEEVLLTFRKSPYILATSEKKLQCNMDFLVNTLKCEPSLIMLYPQFFMTSMEAKIIPRYRVLQMLRSMQLPKESFSVINMISTSEKRFLDKFVYKYGESSGLYELYKGMDGTLSSPDLEVKKGECDKIEQQ